MKWHRVWAVVLRHAYNFRHNFDRVVDSFYWPSLDIVVWGLTISAMEKQGLAGFNQVFMIIVASVLWFIMWRGQGEITVNLLEELWSENLTNLFASPLRVIEWMVGLCIIGLIKLSMTITLTSILAFGLYRTNILDVGFWLIPFSIVLTLFSWSFGFLTAGLFLRKGTDVQTLAWSGAFLLMPFSAVYYPLNSLPQWVQTVASFLPTTYIFEAMRAFVQTGASPQDAVIKALLLDVVYVFLGVLFFMKSFASAKEKGLGHLK